MLLPEVEGKVLEDIVCWLTRNDLDTLMLLDRAHSNVVALNLQFKGPLRLITSADVYRSAEHDDFCEHIHFKSDDLTTSFATGSTSVVAAKSGRSVASPNSAAICGTAAFNECASEGAE